MQHKLKLLPVILALMFLVACGKQAIIVDTSGLPPEQAHLVEWKVKYAVAVDWYDYALRSLKANLAALPEAKAKQVYADIAPYREGVKASLAGFRAVVYGNSPGDEQEAYEAYLQAKAAMLAALVRLFD